MAGETSAELTIVVRAQDAATRVIDGIGRTIGRVLMTPLTAVGKAVTGIFKQFLSLKTLLVGGGIIAATRGLVNNLAKAADQYRPFFSDETQSKIDATASAFSKLGASFQSTFAKVVVELDIAGKLNAMSDWLRDNQTAITQGFKDIGYAVRAVGDAFEYASHLAKSFFMAVGEKMWGKNGIHPQGTSTGGPAEDLPFMSGGSGPGDIPGFGGPPGSRLFNQDMLLGPDPLRAATVLPELQRRADEASKAVAGVVEIVEKVPPATEKAAESTGKLADAYVEVVQEAKAAIIAFEEVADTIAGNVTDGLFAFIEGTQSAGRAFASMVSSILRELGRLLVYRSLLRGILGLASGGGGALSDSSAGGAFTSESGFGGATGVNFASGGTMRRGGVATVGENGPERVFLPAGSHVMSSNRSRDGGGDTINVYGARDPKATAREVAYERRRSAGLRRALA